MQRNRIAAGLGLVIACLALWTSSASAHVTVSGPYPVNGGGYTKLVFRVPNERDDAGTVKLRVQFPKEAVFRSVGNKPMPGWTYEMKMRPVNPPIKSESGADITEVVDEVSWTAQPGTRIAPHEFQEFELSAGALPKDVATLSFPAIQTYDAPDKDGITDVEWIQKRKEGEKEPAKPEPLLKIDNPGGAPAAGAASVSASAVQGGGSEQASANPAAVADAQSAADSAKTFGIIGLILGAIALIAAIAGLARKPKGA